MQSMAKELKARGNKTAVTRSICGLLGAALLFILFSLNVFKLPRDIIARWQFIAYIMCALVAIASTLNWVRAGKNSLLTGIKKFCDTTPNPEATMMRLEKTWKDGLDFNTGRIDNEYIIYLPGMTSKIIPLKNAVWVYKDVSKDFKTGVAYIHLFICFDNNEYQSIAFHNHDAINMILNYISENRPDIAVGHEKETEKLYNNKDMDGLRKYARAKRSRI